MINLENYQDLLQIQSLDMMIKAELDKIDQQNQRINFLQNQEKLKLESLDQIKTKTQNLKEEISSLEKELFSEEKKLQNAKDQQNSVLSAEEQSNLEKTLKQLQERTDDLQEKVLESLENIESLETEEKEIQGFLEGFKESFLEIQQEVENEKAEHQKKIQEIEKRISLLKENIEPALLGLFDTSQKRHRFSQPLTHINNAGACATCRMSLDQQIKAQVEGLKGKSLCSGCKRLLYPLSARS